MSKKVFDLTRSEFCQNFLYLNGEPYSLADYPHMIRVFDSNAKNKVMMFSRQTSKCEKSLSLKRLANGTQKLVKDLLPGDELLSFDEQSQKIVLNKIKHVEPNGDQIIYKIKTRTGRVAEVSGEHPFWTLQPQWTEAKDLQEGDLIGLSRNNSIAVPTEKTIEDYKYIIIAHLLAEGGLTGGGITYTNTELENVKELEFATQQFNSDLCVKSKGENYPGQYRITHKITKPYQKNELVGWLRELNLFNCGSQTKFHPDFIFQLTKEQIIDYLKIFWNTDGYVSVSSYNSGFPNIGIGLISEKLIDGIQELLLRLSIHSRKKISKQPKVYEGTDKQVYVLSVEGIDSVERFYSLIHTRKLKPFQKKNSNSNRSIVPKKALQLYLTNLKKKSYRKYKTKRHNNGGMSWTLKYDLTYSKLKDMADITKGLFLNTIYNADIIYDRIKSIEILPPEPTTSIEMESPYNTFLIDNLVTHNSTSMAMMMIANSIMIPYFKTLYIAPTVDQSKVFSHDRIAPVIEGSPLIKNHFMNNAMVQNVHAKQFTNGSKMYIRYALLSSERTRGFSADMNIFDEVQSLKKDIIPVVKETMSRSLYKHTLYAGTPMRSKGTLAEIWRQSSQMEFIVKCYHCGHWNILDEGSIGLNGVICKHCGKEPDLKQGKWVSTYSLTQEPILEGYRVSALNFSKAPWVNWKEDILIKREINSRGIFYNETLALEYDSGISPITEMELQACCDINRIIELEPNELDRSYPSMIGIDYGPTNSENSNTVISVIQKRPDRYVVVYAKKFLGKEADYSFIHKEIPKIMQTWNCSHLAADYGMGEASNSEIRSKIGFDRVVAFQHEANQKENIRWNPKLPAFTISRSKMMNALFEGMKKRKVEFPRWDYFKPFADDILNILTEYDEESGKAKFVNVGPDDFFHATLYAIISLDMLSGSSLLVDHLTES